MRYIISLFYNLFTTTKLCLHVIIIVFSYSHLSRTLICKNLKNYKHTRSRWGRERGKKILSKQKSFLARKKKLKNEHGLMRMGCLFTINSIMIMLWFGHFSLISLSLSQPISYDKSETTSISSSSSLLLDVMPSILSMKVDEFLLLAEGAVVIVECLHFILRFCRVKQMRIYNNL